MRCKIVLILLIASLSVSAEDFYLYHLYLVKPGDTISHITRTLLPGQIYGPNGSLQKVILCNPSIKNNPDLIFPGEQILLDTSDQQLCAPKIFSDESWPELLPMTEENLPVVQETTAPEEITLKATTFSAAAGYTMLTYEETGTHTLSQQAISVKGSYRRPLSWENFDLGISTNFTLLPLDTNQNISARFLGFNFRLGWTVPQISSPWQLTLVGGWYYITMFVSGNAFGFHGIQGPQAFLLLKRLLTLRDAVSIYFKYSPITNGASLMALSNREIAIGGGWARGLQNGHALLFTLDWTNLSFAVGPKIVNSRSLCLSFGHSW